MAKFLVLTNRQMPIEMAMAEPEPWVVCSEFKPNVAGIWNEYGVFVGWMLVRLLSCRRDPVLQNIEWS